MISKNLIGVICILFGIIIIESCEKNITLNLPVIQNQIVVEGYVFQDTFAYVLLSRNTPFFSQIDSSQLQQYIIRGAKVVISDGTITDTMKEFDIGQATIYVSLNIKGQPNKTYSLHVEADGKVITAQTFLPPSVKLDSAWWKVDGSKDSLGFVWAHLTDPDTLGNNYRWFAERINHYAGTNEQKDSIFIAPEGSVTEDKFFNGKSFNFFYNRGRLPNSLKTDDNNVERDYFKRGDTIVVRFCTIDRATFEFWRTEETQIGSNGNPFANAAPIKSNINGGLGVWGAYGVSYDTVIAR